MWVKIVQRYSPCKMLVGFSARYLKESGENARIINSKIKTITLITINQPITEKFLVLFFRFFLL